MTTGLEQRPDRRDPTTRRRTSAIVAVLVAILVAGLAWAWWKIPEPSDSRIPPTTSLQPAPGAPVVTAPSASPPTTAAPGAQPPAAGLEDGETFGYLMGYELGSFIFDPAELLSGEEARAAAVADGAINEGEDLPNDIYIRNPPGDIAELTAADNVEITLLGFDSDGGVVELPFTQAELVDLFAGAYQGPDIYGLAAETIPVRITIENGQIKVIGQEYLP